MADISTPLSPAAIAHDPSLLVGRVNAARLCGRSPATWDRLVSAGHTPRPIKLGSAVLFKRSDLEEWVRLNCPTREVFEALTVADQEATKPIKSKSKTK